MDTLRRHLSEFIATETTLRDTRIQAIENTTRFMLASQIVIPLVFGGGLAVYIRRQLFGVAELYRDALTNAETQTRALRVSEERFRVTLASLGDAVIATDSAGRVTFLNAAVERLTGWTSSEAVGQDILSVFRIINEHTRTTVENPITRTLRDGHVVGLANHTLLIARDGTERPIDDSGAPIRDSTGNVIGAVLVFRDISERRRAEEIAVRLAAIVTSSSDAIVSKTLDGIVTTWNASAERMFGYTADEIIGQPITTIIPQERRAEEDYILTRLRAGERVEAFDTVRMAKDGRHLDVSLTISPMKNAAGIIIGASKIARDIIARKQAEEERNRLLEREQTARAEAQEAVHLRDIFLSVAGHELRTPLTSLLGNVQLIQRRAEREGILAERDQRVFEVVIAQTKRLNRMVEALLDVSRLEIGQLSLERALLDIRLLVQQVVNEIQPTLTQHTIASTAPEVSLMVEGDMLRLEQVLQNLIQNAVKYSPNGGAIHVQVRQEGATACVDVIDNGIGIPEEAQARLFTRFYRAGNASAEHISGLGIRLYVVKEIVTLHGGTITFESIASVGSTFTVCLPLFEQTDAPDEQGTSHVAAE
jgi:PAS domain S-box-containing protein